MKRRFALVMLGLFLILNQSVHAQSQTIRDDIDQRLALLWDKLLQKQLQHYISYGHWFQGIIWHGSIPNDGFEFAIDNFGARPSDQTTNWVDFLGADLPATANYALKLDTYEGPQGGGFTATVYVYYQNILYCRSKAIGPEKHTRTIQWMVCG